MLNGANLTPGRPDNQTPATPVLAALGEMIRVLRRQQPTKPRPPKRPKRLRLAWDASYIERWRITHEVWCSAPPTLDELARIAGVTRAQALALYNANPAARYADVLCAIHRATHTAEGRPKYLEEVIGAMRAAAYEHTRS